MSRTAVFAAILMLSLAPMAVDAAEKGGAPTASFTDGLAAYERGDYAAALDLFRPAASEGNAAAQYYLGMAYEHGDGVAQDYAAATKWYRAAAEQGNAQAQYRLGALYEYGRGVAQDYERAFMWFDISSASGKFFGVSRREMVAKKMTPEQIDDAKKLEQDCRQRHLSGCS
jgi:TPR repeat protein